ncbi:hypothetical protein SNEBB_000789 [Seison nebaliae]|nr:hypothetical protein SNEBB_000789 [Seison nebaliae]
MEDTEWNDQLRRFGIIPEKEKGITEEDVIAIIDETVKKYTKDDKKPEEMKLDELNENEDDIDDEIFLKYKQQRMKELVESNRRKRFGRCIQITASDYKSQVNDAGDDVNVVLHLYENGIPICEAINKYFDLLAPKFQETKFIRSIASTCVPNFPPTNLPAIFHYKNGELKKQLIGGQMLGETNSHKVELREVDLEWKLKEMNAIENSELTEDPRRHFQLKRHEIRKNNKFGNFDSDSDIDSDPPNSHHFGDDDDCCHFSNSLTIQSFNLLG